jgi:hypothetical protein
MFDSSSLHDWPTALRSQQRFVRAALVHGAVPLGHSIERQRQVEHLTKEPMTNWTGLMDRTLLPISSTMPQYSCAIGVGSVTGLMPR